MKFALIFLLLTATPAWAFNISLSQPSRAPVVVARSHRDISTEISGSSPVGRTRSHLSPPAVKNLLARVTVYWAKGRGSDRDSRNHRSATGVRLQAGHCAVDSRRIPYGSKVTLATGEALTAVDTGSAVRSRRAARKAGHSPLERAALVVDRFFETKGQALTWAATHPLFLTITVLPPS